MQAGVHECCSRPDLSLSILWLFEVANGLILTTGGCAGAERSQSSWFLHDRSPAPRRSPAKSQNEANLHRFFTVGARFGAEVSARKPCKKSKRSQSSPVLHGRRPDFGAETVQKVKTKPILPEWQSNAGGDGVKSSKRSQSSRFLHVRSAIFGAEAGNSVEIRKTKPILQGCWVGECPDGRSGGCNSVPMVGSSGGTLSSSDRIGPGVGLRGRRTPVAGRQVPDGCQGLVRFGEARRQGSFFSPVRGV